MRNDRVFTVRDILERPVFGRARLAAGQEGLHRQVGWVHVLEITNVSPFVSPHDLILSTGLWLQSEDGREAYLMQLIHREAAGLCVEFGTSIDGIPEALIELANEYQFPLIVFEQPVRFVEITQDIHSLLINHQHQLLKSLETYSRELQQRTLQSTDMSAVLELLHLYASKPIVYISSMEAGSFVPGLAPEMEQAIYSWYSQEVEQLNLNDSATELWFHMDEEHALLCYPVVCFGQVFSAIGMVVHPATAVEYLKLLLDYTAKAAAALTLRSQFLEEKMVRSQNELIQDLMNGHIQQEEQARTRMGLRLLVKGQYWFAGGVLEIEHRMKGTGRERMEANHQDVLVLLRSLLKKNHLTSLLMLKNNQIYLCCAKEESRTSSRQQLMQMLEGITQHIKRFAGTNLKQVEIHAGFGKLRNQLTRLKDSLQEAYQVIEVARSVKPMKHVHFYDRMGIYQMLKAMPTSLLQTFAMDHLGVLMEHDRNHQLRLVETLHAYLSNFGSKRDAAAQLFVHRQTLYNRLEKLEELLGPDYMQQDKRLCLEMALLANAMIEGGEGQSS
ncbi:PucR family transcriptional regulator ligand-binding domain-containing protein [Paenibacillus barcinonensis]|uniref:PucR family transcriptional regulator ligand-binding domain-containing protein n=1 Tax=Paenibacillus barcinonensis TaxID=198119 RepID=A0A2V4VUH5_PAEBA|nr:PucR family transcriptional regulator ligand-binding domain-containing protein [Paenibacillus barcinonensis]PYE48583.1 purine catabolism regulator [Paenibacillus barcinonensis]QKS58724.1 PucR family transcriptional regulator ligand-binding domain-containing protein [Paenibacillus barcinonensis]